MTSECKATADRKRANDDQEIHAGFHRQRVDDGADNLEDFIENVFAAEVIKLSMDELDGPELSFHQQFARQHARAFADDIRQFLVDEATHQWGLSTSDLRTGVGRSWQRYVGIMARPEALPTNLDRRRLIESWIRLNSVALPWAAGLETNGAAINDAAGPA